MWMSFSAQNHVLSKNCHIACRADTVLFIYAYYRSRVELKTCNISISVWKCVQTDVWFWIIIYFPLLTRLTIKFVKGCLVCVGWDDVNFGASNEGISVSVMHVEHLVWTHAAWCYTCFHFLVSNKSSQSAVSFAAMRLTHCVQSSIVFGGVDFFFENDKGKGRCRGKRESCSHFEGLCGFSIWPLPHRTKGLYVGLQQGSDGMWGAAGPFHLPLQHSQAHQLSA